MVDVTVPCINLGILCGRLWVYWSLETSVCGVGRTLGLESRMARGLAEASARLRNPSAGFDDLLVTDYGLTPLGVLS